MSMVFWLGLAEGCVALMAAAEVTHATWHRPILNRMLSAYAMIPVIGVMFLAFIPQLDIYPWIDEHGLWLNKPFFIARHLVLVLVVFLLARRFAADTLRGVDSKRFWGVFYLIAFMAHQSMVGLEWVMSLEKPWFSTLFGAWFMVSALLSGTCVGAIILFGWRSRFDEPLRYAQKSIGGLMFGFATFWAYFYFSQLIVIWYGNLPEEVGYLARRIGYHTPYWALARLIFAMCWVIPFAVLMGRKPKTMPSITLAVGITIMTGLLCEYWLAIHPVASVNPVLGIFNMLLVGVLFASILLSGNALLPEVPMVGIDRREALPVHR